MQFVKTEVDKNILLIGLNRPEKLNAFNVLMLDQLSNAYTLLEQEKKLSAGVLYGVGDHFTVGLDLEDEKSSVRDDRLLFRKDLVDPLQLIGKKKTKPVVVAVSGYCFTIGIELILANEICIASENTTFGQLEVKRGLFPFGGATIRFTRQCGWGNAMRYMLTGDLFDAKTALQMGLIQEISKENSLNTALKIARLIADQAPLGIKETLESANQALNKGYETATKELLERALRILETEDAKEGFNAFKQRRAAKFKGK